MAAGSEVWISHRQTSAPAASHIGIEARIVDLHQLAVFAQVQAERLQNSSTRPRPRALHFSSSSACHSRSQAHSRASIPAPPPSETCGRTAAIILRIAGNGFGISAGQVQSVCRLQASIQRAICVSSARPSGESGASAPSPNRCVCTSMTGNFACATGCSATCSVIFGSYSRSVMAPAADTCRGNFGASSGGGLSGPADRARTSRLDSTSSQDPAQKHMSMHHHSIFGTASNCGASGLKSMKPSPNGRCVLVSSPCSVPSESIRWIAPMRPSQLLQKLGHAARQGFLRAVLARAHHGAHVGVRGVEHHPEVRMRHALVHGQHFGRLVEGEARARTPTPGGCPPSCAMPAASRQTSGETVERGLVILVLDRAGRGDRIHADRRDCRYPRTSATLRRNKSRYFCLLPVSHRIHAGEIGRVSGDAQVMVLQEAHQLLARFLGRIFVERHVRRKTADLDAVITGVRQPLHGLFERNRIVRKRTERKSPTA